MADEEALHTITLRNDFYRDNFYRALIVMGIFVVSILLLLIASAYIHFSKPAPITFKTGNDWRLMPDVSLQEPYLKRGDLLQWVSATVPAVFNFDFLNYSTEVNNYTHFFTPDGWKKYIAFLVSDAHYNTVHDEKLFVSANLLGAPSVITEGLLNGRYGWWVQVPLLIHLDRTNIPNETKVTLQVLVVRKSILDDIDGVIIDNMVVAPKGGN